LRHFVHPVVRHDPPYTVGGSDLKKKIPSYLVSNSGHNTRREEYSNPQTL
jgi:hypothetical protein